MLKLSEQKADFVTSLWPGYEAVDMEMCTWRYRAEARAQGFEAFQRLSWLHSVLLVSYPFGLIYIFFVILFDRTTCNCQQKHGSMAVFYALSFHGQLALWFRVEQHVLPMRVFTVLGGCFPSSWTTRYIKRIKHLGHSGEYGLNRFIMGVSPKNFSNGF